jgi:hypothetical protein
MDVQLAEMTGQSHVLRQVDRLVAKEDHAEFRERVMQLLDLAVRERPGEIDVADLRADMGRERVDADGLVAHPPAPGSDLLAIPSTLPAIANAEFLADVELKFRLYVNRGRQ